jgi:rubredoxin
MDEHEWMCDLCGLVYDTEAQVLDCGWLDQAYGTTADLEDTPTMTAAA